MLSADTIAGPAQGRAQPVQIEGPDSCEMPLDGLGPIRTLVLDDDAVDRRRIRRLSERSDLILDIDEVPTIAALAQAMDRTRYDLVLVDYHLTDGTGLEALQAIRAHDANQDSAVIMVSGQSVRQVMAPAFHGGAQDFLSKDDMSPGCFRTSVMQALSHAARRRQMAPLGPAELQVALHHALTDPAIQRSLRAAILDGADALSEIRPDFAHRRAEATDDVLLAMLLSDDSFDFDI